MTDPLLIYEANSKNLHTQYLKKFYKSLFIIVKYCSHLKYIVSFLHILNMSTQCFLMKFIEILYYNILYTVESLFDDRLRCRSSFKIDISSANDR